MRVLAEAFLADGEGRTRPPAAERGLKIPGQDKSTALMSLAGEGYYIAGQLPPRARSSRARWPRQGAGAGAPTRASRSLLVDTINRQAAARFSADDLAGAEKLLGEAQGGRPESTRTNFNLGVVAIEKGRFQEDAIRYLNVRLARTPSRSAHRTG